MEIAQPIGLSREDFLQIQNHTDLLEKLKEKDIDISSVLKRLRYEKEKELLQVELVKLQRYIKKNNLRVAVIFEGRDAAGKGGNIRRFMEHLNPRSMRLVALNKPTDVERGQWYFRRYIQHLPNPGDNAGRVCCPACRVGSRSARTASMASPSGSPTTAPA